MFWVLFLLAALCTGWWLIAAGLARVAQVTGRLVDLPLVDREEWPSVAVIAPARDEAAVLEDAVRSRLRSDYPALTVVIVNDRSTDETGAIADRLADDPRVRAVHISELPAGWLGKLNALQTGVDATDTDWLLFSDSDVHVAPGTLRRAIHLAEESGLDLLAVMPRIEPAGVLNAGLHSVFLPMLAVAFDARRAEDPKSSFAPAVGAFSLVRRSALDATPGFESLRLCVDDDLQLGLMLKASGARCSVRLGVGAVSVDLYPTAWDAVVGAEKNAWGVAASFSLLRGLAVCLMLPLFHLSPWILLWLAPTIGWTVFAGLSALVAASASVGAFVLNGRRPWGVLLHPVGVALLTFAMLRGTLKGWREGGLSWRGTHYPTETFRAFKAERKTSPSPRP
jgi:hypothetical protein